MKSITINLDEEDVKTIEEIFKNEPNFQPRVRQDYLIISILKQILENSKLENTKSTNADSNNDYRLE